MVVNSENRFRLIVSGTILHLQAAHRPAVIESDLSGYQQTIPSNQKTDCSVEAGTQCSGSLISCNLFIIHCDWWSHLALEGVEWGKEENWIFPSALTLTRERGQLDSWQCLISRNSITLAGLLTDLDLIHLLRYESTHSHSFRWLFIWNKEPVEVTADGDTDDKFVVAVISQSWREKDCRASCLF